MNVKIFNYAGNCYSIFYARRNIEIGEEMEYDYGEGDYPWRQTSENIFIFYLSLWIYIK